jgi:hypothetical protein
MNMRSMKFAACVGMALLMTGASMVPTTVSAQGVELNLRNGDVRVRPADDYDPRYDRRYDRRDDRRRPGCSPREALSKASRYLQQPRIASADRRSYYIEGYGKQGRGRNRPDSVTIANAPGCDRL